LEAKKEDYEEPLVPDKGSVPDRETGSCLDPMLPGTGLQEGGKKGQPARSWQKESVGTQQRWGNHEKRQRKIHSSRDEGGSKANRVRRFTDDLKEVTLSIHCVIIVFSFRRINHLVLNHSHGSSVNTLLTSRAEQ
jgi:hypothetical protein